MAGKMKLTDYKGVYCFRLEDSHGVYLLMAVPDNPDAPKDYALMCNCHEEAEICHHVLSTARALQREGWAVRQSEGFVLLNPPAKGDGPTEKHF